MGRRHLTNQWVWALASLAVVSFGVWMGRAGPSPAADDWGQYLLHAEALAEGRQYTDIRYEFSHYAWGTGSPVAAPGLPLAMAPIVATIGFQHWMHVGFNMLGILILMAIMGRYFGRNHPTRALSAAVLVGFALILVRGADTLQPDIPFAVLIWGTLLLADSVENWSWARTAGIALLGLWAILFRVAALPLIPAMAVFGVLTWKAHKRRPFLITAIWIFATAFLLLVVESGRIPPPEAYIEIPPESDIQATLWQLVTGNLISYRLSMFELQLYPFSIGSLNDVYHLIMTPLVLLGLLIWLEGSWFRCAAVFGAAYVGMLLVAPFAVERYLWPLWPLGAYGLMTGLDAVLDRLPVDRVPKNGFRSAAVMSVVVATAIATNATREIEPSVYSLDSVQEVVEFVKALPADEDLTAVFFLPRTFAWTTGVRTMAMFSAPSNEAVIREIDEKGATHLVLGTLGHPGAIPALERWVSTITTYPDRFEEVFENADFTIYRIKR